MFSIQRQTSKHVGRNNSLNTKVSYPSRTVVHPKLETTEPGDCDEKEADVVANDVVSGRVCRQISHGNSGGGMAVSSHMESRLNSLQGGGQVMPDGLRNMMERGFNRDFSHVRVHTDTEAASLSSSINAKAFTLGNDIYFNQGQFSPDTSEGQRLMAHELTHVVQGGSKVARENLSSKNEDIKTINNTLPVTCGDLSDNSKTKLNTIIRTFYKNISQFKEWRNCTFFNEDYYGATNQEIPDISILLNDSNINSIFNSDEYSSFECANNPMDKISYKHHEVVNYLRDNIDEEYIKLFVEWMKYSRINYCNISKLLGIAPISIKDFVEHTYNMHLNFSAELSVGIGIASVGIKYSNIVVSYENNLGMKWKIELSENEVSGSVGLSIPVSGNVGKTASENLCNATAHPRIWYSPNDFIYSFSLGVSGNAEVALPLLKADGSFSGFRYMFKDKPTLFFNSSGLCEQLGFGGQLGIGGTGSIKGTFLPEYQSVENGELRDITYTEKHPLTNVEEFLYNGSIYFDTGSSDLYSGTFKDENNRIINQIVNTIISNYDSELVDRITIYTIAHSSPLWKNATTHSQAEEKNRELAKKRNENVYDNLIGNIIQNSKNSSNYISAMSFVPKCIDDPALNQIDLSDSNRGSDEGLEKTNDYKNNDWNFRRVDIAVGFNRKIDNRILPNKPYSDIPLNILKGS